MFNREIVFFGLLVLLLPFASAQLSVSVNPLEAPGPFYPNEVKYYSVTVSNESDFGLKDVRLLVSNPSNDYSFLVDSSDEMDERFFSILNLGPFASESKTLEMKAVGLPKSDIDVTFEYGVSNLENSFSYPFSIVQGPIVFDSAPNSLSIKPEEQSFVSFTLSNISSETITNIDIELFSDSDALVISSPFVAEKLLPGESIYAQIPFQINEEIGDSKLTARLFFEDAKGSHVIEHSSPLNVDDSGILILIFIAAILLLVIIHFQLKNMQKSGKYEERFSGKEEKE